MHDKAAIILRTYLAPNLKPRFSWPTAAVALVAIHVFLTLAIGRGKLLAGYFNISDALLLFAAATLAFFNASRARQSARLFWTFLALGYAFWAINPCVYIYSMVFGRTLAPFELASPPLVLHTAFLTAAALSRPHLKLLTERPYRKTLNFLILLFFSFFLYAYFMFPYSYEAGTRLILWRFAAFYFCTNLLLLAVLGLLTLRSQPPWKLIYGHLLGASSLYLIASMATIAVLALKGPTFLDLLGAPFTAASCWFVWIGIKGRKLAPELDRTVQIESADGRRTSLAAVLAVTAIPVIGIIELFRSGDSHKTQIIRLLIVLVSATILLIMVFLRDSFANRELLSDVAVANNRLRLAVLAGKSVSWDWDFRNGKSRWFGDLNTVFGIPSDSCYEDIEDFRCRVHPDDRELAWKAFDHARQHQEPYIAEFRVLRDDQTVRWISASGKFYYTGNGDAERMLGMVVDITERHRSEEAARESEERFRLVANTAPVMIWMSGPDKLCSYFNEPWLEFTGRSFQEELGNGWTEGVHPEDLIGCMETYTRAFDRRESFQMEYRLRRHDGVYRWIFDHGVLRVNADGSFAGYIGSCMDVTERKLAEEALSSVSRRLIEAHEEERTRIARELHDDINQRIASVSHYLDRLKEGLSRSAVQARFRVEEAIQQIRELGSDIQTLSHRLHSSKLEYLGLTAAAKSFCRELCDRQDVEIAFRADGIPIRLPQEISLCLFRVLQEALQNATKHSGSKRFEASLACSSNEIHLTVRDSGIGFDPKEALNGQGLGLTSMRERMKLVHGKLSIDSRCGAGTLVRASVPIPDRAGLSENAKSAFSND